MGSEVRVCGWGVQGGCRARVWVALTVTTSADGQVLRQGTVLRTRIGGQPTVVSTQDIASLRSRGAVVFETTHDLLLRSAHSRMRVDPSQGPLALGAQSAALLDTDGTLMLCVGDVLIFEDRAEPAAAAVAAHKRQAVRLTSVEVTQNPAG